MSNMRAFIQSSVASLAYVPPTHDLQWLPLRWHVPPFQISRPGHLTWSVIRHVACVDAVCILPSQPLSGLSHPGRSALLQKMSYLDPKYSLCMATSERNETGNADNLGRI
jgi:hypothetical protein